MSVREGEERRKGTYKFGKRKENRRKGRKQYCVRQLQLVPFLDEQPWARLRSCSNHSSASSHPTQSPRRRVEGDSPESAISPTAQTPFTPSFSLDKVGATLKARSTEMKPDGATAEGARQKRGAELGV